MREIYVINPSRKRRRSTKRRKVTKMAKRRKRSYKRRAAPRKRARRNPAPRPNKRAARRVARSFGGISFKKCLKDMIPIQIGMFAAKWGAKRFDPDASETDPASWNWSSYLKGALGAVGAALLAGSFKPGMAQKVLEGGVNLMVFKAVQNEVITGSAWATEQFGEDDDYVPDEYEGMLLTGETPDGNEFMLGQDTEFYPANDDYRVGQLEPVGPLGDELVPVGPLGVNEAYRRAFYPDA